MSIDEWLSRFVTAWKSQDIDSVMNLFDPNVEYWETPFNLLRSFEDLRSEWMAINDQNNISITTNVFQSDGHKNSVTWSLPYAKDGKSQKWAGTYLIKLNDSGKCTYFYQTGECS